RIRPSRHFTSHVLGPRLIRRRRQSVCRGAYLQNYGVQPKRGRPIENLKKFIFLLLRRESPLGRPVDVLHGRDPYPAEFSSDWRRRCKGLYRIYLRLSARIVETAEHEK